MRDPAFIADRQENRSLLDGHKGRCRCGEQRAAAMCNRRLGEPPQCCRCRLRELGKSLVEDHHVFGRDVAITVVLPVNVHRVIDALRLARWPEMRKPGCRSLDNIAGLLMQFVEIAEIVAAEPSDDDWVVTFADILADVGRSAVERLLLIEAGLVETHGDDWQAAIGEKTWRPTRGTDE